MLKDYRILLTLYNLYIGFSKTQNDLIFRKISDLILKLILTVNHESVTNRKCSKNLNLELTMFVEYVERKYTYICMVKVCIYIYIYT